MKFKFKIGDKVKIVQKIGGYKIGDTFIIEEIVNDGFTTWIRPTKGQNTGINGDNLELVKPTRFNVRKLNKQLI